MDQGLGDAAAEEEACRAPQLGGDAPLRFRLRPRVRADSSPRSPVRSRCPLAADHGRLRARYTSSNAENVNLVEAELHRRWGHEVIVGRRVMLTKGEGFGGVGGSYDAECASRCLACVATLDNPSHLWHDVSLLVRRWRVHHVPARRPGGAVHG